MAYETEKDLKVSLVLGLKQFERGFKRAVKVTERYAKRITRTIAASTAKLSGGVVKSALKGVVGLVSGTVSKVLGLVTGLIGKVVKLVTGFVGKITGLVGKAVKWGTLAIAGLAAAAVGYAAKVEDAWSKVRTIIDLGGAAEKVKNELRNLAVKTGRSLTEIIEGYYQVVSAGYTRAADAMAFLKATLEGSIAGWTEFPTVVLATSRTMRNFGVAAEHARLVMDMLLKTVDVGQIQLPELAAVIGQVGNFAGAAGARIEEMLAALGILAQTGPPEIVATQLRGFFARLATQDPGAIRRSGGLVGYLQQLKAQGPGGITKLFPDIRAQAAARSLIKMLPQVAEAIGKVRNASGKTAENFAARMDTLLAQWRRTWQAAKAVAESFGAPIVAVLKDWAKDTPAMIMSVHGAFGALGQKVADVMATVREFFSDRVWNWQRVKANAGQSIGLLKDMVVTALEYVKQRTIKVLADLWAVIGEDVKRLTNQIMVSIAATLRRAIAGLYKPTPQEVSALAERLKFSAEDWGPEAAFSYQGALYGVPTGLDWQGRQDMARKMMMEQGTGLTAKEIPIAEALGALANVMQSVGTGAGDLPNAMEWGKQKAKEAGDAAGVAADKLRQLATQTDAVINRLAPQVAAAGANGPSWGARLSGWLQSSVAGELARGGSMLKGAMNAGEAQAAMGILNRARGARGAIPGLAGMADRAQQIINDHSSTEVKVPIEVMGLMTPDFVRSVLVPTINRAIAMGWVKIPKREK